MITKTAEEIRQELLEAYQEYLPNIDLTEGTPERDLFIEAPLEGVFEPMWEESVYVSKLHAPHIYYEELDESDIENYIEPYGITGLPATYSTGTCIFYTYNDPENDITITAGTVVTTDSNPPIEFVVTDTATIFADTAITYYNLAEERWEIETNVRAVENGPEYRAGPNTVVLIDGNIDGIEGVTNPDSILGGEEAETTESKLNRVVQKFQGRDLGSTVGLQSFIESYSPTANIVGANDPLMERDNGLGGAIDIYIIDTEVTNNSETVTISEYGLNNPTTVNYTTTTVTLSKQPVTNLVSFLLNDTIVDTEKYTLTSDTGLLKNSTRGFDKLELTETSGYHSWGFNNTISENTASGLNNDSTVYGFRVSVDAGSAQNILVTGSSVQTIGSLCSEIDSSLTDASCEFDPIDNIIKIISDNTGISSTIFITDGGATGQDEDLFANLNNIKSTPESAVPGEDIIPFVADDKIEITYTYNSALEELEEDLNSESNHYHGRDYLIRAMEEIQIDMTLRFKEVSGQDFSTVSASVESAVSDYIDSIRTEQRLELSDVISVITRVGGVDNIDLDTITIDPVGGGSKVGNDVYIGKNQYMSTGDFSITRWTNT